MNWAWASSLDQLWQSPALPVLITLAVGAFFALMLLVTLFRAEKSIANGALAVITLLALTVAVAASMRSFGSGERFVADSRPVPAHGAVSLPALACLDGLAGESVEAACEKALFASAESSAAAVSYTASQISRLTAQGDVATANAAMTPELATLRRVIERDRYGLVAQVLLTREQCSPTACGAFRSLADRKQIAANMAERAYDSHVGRHAANWGAPQAAAIAPATPALAGLPVTAPTGRPTNADFPTAASIPPVNIMGNEPPAAAPPPPPQARTAAPPPPQTQQVPAAALAPPSAAPATSASRASVFSPPPQQAPARPAAAAAAPAPTTATATAAPPPSASRRPRRRASPHTTSTSPA
ncbi:MAG: hypothetical protein A4S14_07900 [Proteobacteria bacterium SG_bin9]|nr:MAG: hypothetical protein A4S14_07900 [Proteobacteria bacterium SG_bin9]